MLVDEQKVRPGVIRNRDVRPAVVVEVGENYSHPFRFGLADARGIAHVRKGTVMIVVIQLDSLPSVIAGMAVRTIAGPVLSAPQVVLWTPLNVVGDHQVEPAVFVVVEPSRAGGPAAFVRDTCF